MRRVYLDTCIVIYLIENTGMHSERSRDFLAANNRLGKIAAGTAVNIFGDTK